MAALVLVRSTTAIDAANLAQASLIAARGHLGWGLYDVALPVSEDVRLRILRQIAADDGSSFHSFRQRLVAEVDGVFAGALSVFEAGDAADAALGSSIVAAVSPEMLPGIGRARELYARAAVPHPIGVWAVELVGIRPEFRGLGVAGSLLQTATAVATEGGATRLSVTYELGNEAAEAAYARAGFAVVDERRDADFEAAFRAPGTRRAELRL